ncbi:MAG: hypothetical protein JO001_28615 [Alphaproteobacteria bacterium]|nr:hypothetical protein [Alphaproteobacteria bacterium]
MVGSLEEAGLCVRYAVDATDALQAVRDPRCRALVVALPEHASCELIRAVYASNDDIPIVMVTDPHATITEAAGVMMVRRPLVAHELIGAVLEQVLREGSDAPPSHHYHLAESALAAAELACLCRRHAVALGENTAHLLPFRRRMADLQAQLGID